MSSSLATRTVRTAEAQELRQSLKSKLLHRHITLATLSLHLIFRFSDVFILFSFVTPGIAERRALRMGVVLTASYAYEFSVDGWARLSLMVLPFSLALT